MAQIGENAAEPFNELRSITNDKTGGVRILSRLWAKEYFHTKEQLEHYYEEIDKYKAIFWEVVEKEDPINPWLKKTINDIEKICKGVISGKGTFYGF